MSTFQHSRFFWKAALEWWLWFSNSECYQQTAPVYCYFNAFFTITKNSKYYMKSEIFRWFELCEIMSNPELNMFRTKKSTTHLSSPWTKHQESSLSSNDVEQMCRWSFAKQRSLWSTHDIISKNRDRTDNCIFINFLKVVLEKTNYMQ